MRFTRWQPFRSGSMLDQLETFQHEMNRLLDRWGNNTGRSPGRTAFPLVNVWQEDDALFVQAELPGLEQKDLEIYVTGGNQLSIKGSRKQPEPGPGVWHRQERSFGNFERVLELPFVVDADKVDARFENGVLVVKLAKHESAKPRKIHVRGE